MEIYELPITVEESRNYHNFIYKLKTLSLREWIKSYMISVFYVFVLCVLLYVVSDNVFLVVWFHTGLLAKFLFFVVIFVCAAAQRSKSLQLRDMLQKYFINNLPQEFLNGGIQLKKIKVQKDRLVVYYRRFKADEF